MTSAFLCLLCSFIRYCYLSTRRVLNLSKTQGDQKVCVHLMITIQKFTNIVQSVTPSSHQTFIDTRLTLTPPVIPNYNYVIMVSDWNCLKHFCVFFWYCNHQVYRDFLITLYFSQALGNPNESFSNMDEKLTAVPFNHKKLQWSTNFSLELGLVLDFKKFVLCC
jgi:hypothetical protein